MMKSNHSHRTSRIQICRPSCPNVAEHARRQEQLLDLVATIASGVGIVVLLVFLILL